MRRLDDLTRGAPTPYPADVRSSGSIEQGGTEMNKHLAFLAGIGTTECRECGGQLTVEEYAYGHDCEE